VPDKDLLEDYRIGISVHISVTASHTIGKTIGEKLSGWIVIR